MSHFLPELLSPAGNWDCAKAAVANGADAIFFGLPKFNARLRADNFTHEDLPKLMEFLHQHGVRGYCALNTLIFTDELAAAEIQLRWLEEAGVDAVIIQDLGLARMVKALTPKLQLHASTQMTITSPEGLEFAKQLDLDLAVLSRELSLRELERFQKEDQNVPLEVFVHGALCVAYSGQCLTSESLGRRSANRGECAQACRMPYELILDGEKKDLGDKRYLLSPQDLAAIEEIPRLIELGVKSFKIEGRLKSPDYVAAVTRAYRKAIDAALFPETQAGVQAEDRYALEMTFSRGLFSGWMHGVNHQKLVGARYAKKRGPFVGRVKSVTEQAVILDELNVDLKAGDGVVFENPENTNQEQGGYLFQVQGTQLLFQRGKIHLKSLKPGTQVFKTSDPALLKQLEQTFKGEVQVKKRHALHWKVKGKSGESLEVTVSTVDGKELAKALSDTVLVQAVNKPLTKESLEQQFSRLGGTAYEVASLEVDLEGSLIVPVSQLNQLRRNLVEKLDTHFAEEFKLPTVREHTKAFANVQEMLAPIQEARATSNLDAPYDLTVLCRTNEQIEACLEQEIPTLYLDFEDIRQFKDAVATIRNSKPETSIFLATPRIQKAGEQGFFKLIERAEPDGVILRNLGSINFFRNTDLRMRGDFSLNVANPLTAEFLMQFGFERLTISYDLNIDQIEAFLKKAPPAWFELTLHQHMPMFHMEHCVFAAFLSNGSSFLDCGRPCEHHKVKLRDRVGIEHPLKADVGCRNTLFNANAQTGAKYFQLLSQLGLRQYRIEFLEEETRDCIKTLETYRALLSGKRSGETLWRELKAQSQLGVTTGTLED